MTTGTTVDCFMVEKVCAYRQNIFVVFVSKDVGFIVQIKVIYILPASEKSCLCSFFSVLGVQL